jgi:DNA-binding CsgD family transcriptional regulator/tetratricopeptide (TPR) repeat protein
MAGVTRRSGSARLIGRDRELADLVAAVEADDPDRSVVLVSGEAGIGKTRLLSEMAAALRSDAPPDAGPIVVRGSCLRLAEGELPFAPILEILDGLRESGASAALEAVRARLTGSATEADQSPATRTLRFVEINDALIEAAGGRRLIVVIDDLHWADRSTLDAVLFLARRIRGRSIVLVGAYRSDELHRRHPLRPVIGELTGFVRERIELAPLVDDAVLEQIRMLGDQRDDALARAIVERADGNPFFVEELVALSPDRGELPTSLRDVLLARLASFDQTAIDVLGAAAVRGGAVDVELLGDVAGLDPDATLEAVTAAVDGAILQADPDGSLRFRHALLEEAVHDDLLPARRVELHRRMAAALQRRLATGLDVPPGELAVHLDRGGNTEAAIDAYLATAEVAYRATAWAEAIAAFERASELAARSTGQAQARLRGFVARAAEAMNWTGSSGRAIALLREWIARSEASGDTGEAVTLGLLLTRVYNDSGEEARSREAFAAAARLGSPDESTVAGVDLLLGLAGDAWMPGRVREALELSERAVAAAERLGDHDVLFRALVYRGTSLIGLGQMDRGLADVERCRQLQREYGWLDRFGHFATNVGVTLTEAGFLDLAVEIWQEGLRQSRELGITQSWDPWNLAGLGLAAFYRGEWAEAEASVAAARAFGVPGLPTVVNELVAAQLAAGRGDLAACDRSIATIDAHAVDLIGEGQAFTGMAKVEREDAAGNPARRLDQAHAALARLEGVDTFVLRSRLAAEAASAAADLATSLPRRDRAGIEAARAEARWAATLAADVDAGRAVRDTVSVPWTRANAALAAAESARADDADDPAAWPPIAEAFEALGMPPRVAYARFRGAGAALAAGERAQAETELRKAHGLATGIGMHLLEGRIRAVARAGRIELDAVPPAEPSEHGAAVALANRWGLSAREREVLALVADGRTNNEIGEKLFISAKTASVHVTHILDKLGVSSRTEAALLANQAGILG